MDFEDKAITALVGVGCLMQIAWVALIVTLIVFAIKWLAGNA